MRRSYFFAAVFVAAFSLLSAGLVGCSDDAASDNDTEDTGNTLVDSAHDDDAGPGASPDDTGDDDDTSDSSGDTGPDMEDASDAADSSDPADGGEDGGGGDTGGDGDTGEDDETDPSEGHAGCTYPAEDNAGCAPEDFGDHGPASFLSEFAITESGECCRDFDGETGDDSGLGDLIEMLIDFGVMGNVTDFNAQVIAPQIEEGIIVFLFEYAYWDDPSVDDVLEFNLLFGEDTDGDFDPNMVGNGEFNIDPSSLDISGEPKSDFPAASVVGNRLTASGGSAPLVLPVGSDMIATNVDDLRIEANVDAGADLHAGGGVALTDGEISGYVTVEEMYSSLNTVADNCGCISAPQLYTENDGEWVCHADATDNCSNASEMCQVLATPQSENPIMNCSIVTSVVDSSADVDLDGEANDAVQEAISVGATFEAVEAHIAGVATSP